jgi:hypothetical protein
MSGDIPPVAKPVASDIATKNCNPRKNGRWGMLNFPEPLLNASEVDLLKTFCP